MLHFPYIAGGPETLLVDGEDFVAIAGTLSCDGVFPDSMEGGFPAFTDFVKALDTIARSRRFRQGERCVEQSPAFEFELFE